MKYVKIAVLAVSLVAFSMPQFAMAFGHRRMP